jgi:hypothetical protein
MRLDARPLGLVLVAVGITLGCFGALVIWRTVDRFLLAWGMNDWHGKVFTNDAAGMRSSAQAAAEISPKSPAVILAGLDLHAENAGEKLAALPRHGASADAIEAAAALAAAYAGTEIPGSTGDAALAGIVARPDGTWPRTDRSAPPHKATLAAAYSARLADAWKHGRAADMRQAAAGLQMLFPRHPQAGELALILAALDPEATNDRNFIAQAGNRISDVARRTQLARALYALAPDRKDLATLAFGGITDPAQLALKRLEEDAALVTGSKTPDQVLIRLAQQGRMDLAERLLAPLDDKRKATFAGLGALTNASVANRPADPRAKPRISQPVTRSGLISFHITNGFGGSYTDPVAILIDGKEIPADQVRRMGSLIWSEVAKTGPGEVAIRIGSETLLSERLSF